MSVEWKRDIVRLKSRKRYSDKERRGEGKKKAKSNAYGPLFRCRVVKDTGVTTRTRIPAAGQLENFFFAPILSSHIVPFSFDSSRVVLFVASTHERFTIEVKDTRLLDASFIPKSPRPSRYFTYLMEFHGRSSSTSDQPPDIKRRPRPPLRA